MISVGDQYSTSTLYVMVRGASGKRYQHGISVISCNSVTRENDQSQVILMSLSNFIVENILNKPRHIMSKKTGTKYQDVMKSK